MEKGFYVFTLIFTIVLGATSQALCVNIIPKQYQIIVSLVLVQMTPALGTLFVYLWGKDKDCIKSMNWCPTKGMRSMLWLLLSFLIPAAIIALTAAIMSRYGKTYISNSYPVRLLIMTVLGALIGCIGEEIGWRGFMQPSFNRKYSLFSSAVFTGVLWGAWHFSKLVSYGILGYFLFILLTTEFSVMMAWIYSKANRNMICMVLFHLGINISSILLLTGREGIMFYTVVCIISTLICLALVLADRKSFKAKFSSCRL